MVAICLPVCFHFLAVLAGVAEGPPSAPGQTDSEWEESGMRVVWATLPWVLVVLALVSVVFFIYRARRMDAARRYAEGQLAELRSEREHLMAMLANDLNNPLQTIRLACDSFASGVADQKTLGMVRQTVERMTRLVKKRPQHYGT